jgi:hypothetical protein
LYAKGVSAGTVIENSATLSFSMQEEDFSIESNIVRDVVNQLIDVDVSWMDTRAVVVSSGDKRRVLTFKVINSGNGHDSFDLETDQAGGHSDFKTKGRKIYVDSNDNLKLDKDDKKVSTIALKEDETALIFVSSNIRKKKSLTNGAKSFVNLKATSLRGGSGKRGTLHRGKGIGGIDAIDGIEGGVGWESGIYRLLNANVSLEKSICDGRGSVVNHFHIGSVLTIKIDVTVLGEGSVQGLKISDKIPNEVKYLKNTLRLDGRLLTDEIDRDKGKYLKSDAKIVLKFKRLKAGSKHTISYKVKVKKD